MSELLECQDCGQKPILFGFKLRGVTAGKEIDEEAAYCILCFQKKADAAAKLANAAISGYRLARAMMKAKEKAKEGADLEEIKRELEKALRGAKGEDEVKEEPDGRQN